MMDLFVPACVAGPLAAALCNAYNPRVVVMTGGFLAGLGLTLASQATCLVHLYLTMGVISGNRCKSRKAPVSVFGSCWSEAAADLHAVTIFSAHPVKSTAAQL